MYRLAMLTVALLVAITQPSFAAPPSEDYKLVWQDEFNGDKLDESVWTHHHLGKRRDAINTREAVDVDGQGNLRITTTKVGEQYHTGMIQTRNRVMVRYGYLEARMRFQTQIGHWSAFWMMPNTISKFIGEPGKSGVEIDIIEYLRTAPELVQQNLHWDGYGKDHKSKGHKTPFPGLGDGFHTVGLEWTPTRYTMFVDGKTTWTTDGPISHTPEYVIFSLEVGPWAKNIADAKLPDDFLVDYIRIYQKPDDDKSIINITPE
ncbi:glycoside hydrolase family 16 protein [Planctomycetales bacterium ZRK34]|nr:glycoside hydrolase family 16 protein [Planctomycetales bacterium ZRK34]